MPRYSLRHLADSTLRHDLKQLVITDRGTTARLIAHVAEFLARRLYLEDGYGSMYDYCVGELEMSEDVACERIRAARVARRFPIVLVALEDGRLHLAGIALLAPRLTEENAEELLATSFHRSKRQIRRLLAERFPQPDLPAFIQSLGASSATSSSPRVGSGPWPGPTAKAVELATQPVGRSVPARIGVPGPRPVEPAVQPVDPSVPARMDVPSLGPRVMPLAPGRVGWQFTTAQDVEDLYREVQDLLGHDVPPGDVEAVLRYSFLAAKEKLQKRKFAATANPRPGRQRSADSRHIPAEVRRAVWDRDGGQCAFMSGTGHRCTERKDLEYDHIDPYARDGASSVSNVRLLCRAHNLFEAEQTYGKEFMRRKRERAASP